MKIDDLKSSWAIISAQQPTYNTLENEKRNELLKTSLNDNSYRGYMLDSIYYKQNKVVEEESFLILNHKSEDDFRFDILDFLSLLSPVQEYAIVKYQSEPIAYKVLHTGHEKIFGKFKWGPSISGVSFLFNKYPFSFESALNYKMNYLKYKQATLY